LTADTGGDIIAEIQQEGYQMKYIYVLHEIDGGRLVRAFTDEADAKNYFNWEVYNKNLVEHWYKISKVALEDWG
jgi:hypothetical protein